MTVPTLKVTKKYRLHYRSDDGSATYICTDSEGSELLIVNADGSRSYHMVVGLCDACAYGIGQCPGAECPQRNRREAVVVNFDLEAERERVGVYRAIPEREVEVPSLVIMRLIQRMIRGKASPQYPIKRMIGRGIPRRRDLHLSGMGSRAPACGPLSTSICGASSS